MFVGYMFQVFVDFLEFAHILYSAGPAHDALPDH